MELEDIIERCKNGDQEAQSWLYKRYSRQMLKICYRFVGDKQVAQDLMHDGFIIVFASINCLKHPEKIASWMGRIMTNLALKQINKTRSVSIISDLPEELQPTDDEIIADILPLENLLVIIDNLPEGYRNVFKLSTLDGLSHKEIAELLNIAPHSSSSQLYRAKEYLKKMILHHHYLLLAFILLLIPICSLWLTKDASKLGSSQYIGVANVGNKVVSAVKPDTISSGNRMRYIYPKSVVKVIQLAVDTVNSIKKEVASDTIPSSVPIDKPRTDIYQQLKNNTTPMAPSIAKLPSWTLAFQYRGSGNSRSQFMKNFRTPVFGDISSSTIPPYTDNWNDYYQYLQQYGHRFEDKREMESLKEIAKQNNGTIEEEQYHHLPFTVGVVVHKMIDKHWGVETGVNYTWLVSDFKTGRNAYISQRQNLHYIGIPIRGTYLLGRFNELTIYSCAAITVGIPISGTLETQYVINEKVDYRKHQTLKVPLQWSLSGGLGLQYQFTPSIGVFVEPNINYYFNDGSELRTIRKEHPFDFSLSVGLRFSY